LTDAVPNFSVWEIALGILVALGVQVGGLFLLRTGGGSAARADISDERSRPISVSITPVVDDAPVLKLGSKRVSQLPDRWMAPKPVERPPAPPTTPPPPKAPPSTKASTTPVTDAGPTPPPSLSAEPPKEPPDLSAPVAENAQPAPVATTEGSPEGVREGTETDPLKAHAVDLYRSQLVAWFSNRFVIRGKVPFDTLKDLKATAVIDVGADRNVTGFKVVEQSGNATFDEALDSSLSAIVSGGAELPAPPPNYPDILQSTQRIQFRCDRRSQCE
jgi:hypothetical protein